MPKCILIVDDQGLSASHHVAALLAFRSHRRKISALFNDTSLNASLSLAKTLGVLSFTPLTMLQACAQAVDFKIGHHFGEGQH